MARRWEFEERRRCRDAAQRSGERLKEVEPTISRTPRRGSPQRPMAGRVPENLLDWETPLARQEKIEISSGSGSRRSCRERWRYGGLSRWLITCPHLVTAILASNLNVFNRVDVLTLFS